MNWAHSLTWISCAALIGCNHGAFTQASNANNEGIGNDPAAASVGTRHFSTELQCGLLPVSATGQGEQLQVTVQDQSLAMQQRISASGARYVADTPTETSLWFKGENAFLVIDDMPYPECAPAGAIVEPFRASGNEPFWALTLHHGMLQLNRLAEGESPAQAFTFERTTGELRSQDSLTITGQIEDQICHDTMSGMPYPHEVTLQVDNTSFNGCGGDPARLLQGAEWLVEDINGRGIIDSSNVTLNFWADGRISGRASCNNFMGQYQLSGEGLTIGHAATTGMACAPALMSQEQTVLEALHNVQRFDVDETGALILYSTTGTLKAHLTTAAEGV